MYHIAKINKEGQIEYLNKEGIFCKDIFSARIFTHRDNDDVLEIWNNLREKYTNEELRLFPAENKEGGKDRS